MGDLQLPPQYRDVQIRGIHADKRTLDLSFSSEEPIERWFGLEILDHDPSSVRMERLQNSAPLLADHNPADVIGVIESASIQNGKGRAVVRFSKSTRASEIFQDVQDGIRKSVSVGYRVLKAVMQESDSEGLDTFRVTDWLPLEISIVGIPADDTVGVGRSDQSTNLCEVRKMGNETITLSQGNSGTNAEIERVRQIMDIGKQFNEPEMAREYADGGATVELFQQQILRNMKKPVEADVFGQAADPDIGLTGREVSQYSFCRAIMAQFNRPNTRAPQASSWKHPGRLRNNSGSSVKASTSRQRCCGRSLAKMANVTLASAH